MITMPIMARINIPSAIFSRRCIRRSGARTQRPVRKQTGNQKQKCVAGEKIIRQRIRTSKCNDHTNQSDDSQTNAHHGGGDCENVDADILLQIRARVSVPVRFSFHGNQFLDQSRNRLFRQ